MTKQNANKKILEILSEIVEAQPDWRFGQILENAGTVLQGSDMFFEKSAETLSRMADCAIVEDMRHQHDADIELEGLRSEETDAEELLRKEASGEIC